MFRTFSSSHLRTQLLSICPGISASSSLCCITVVDDNMTRSRKAARCFPGYPPCFGSRVNPTREHVDALGKKEMLNACLLDSLLQRTSMPFKDGRTNRKICHLGNLNALEYFENVNVYFQELADDECYPSPGEATRIRAKVQQTCTTFNKIFQMKKDVVNQFLIPIVDSCHFCVLLVDFNYVCPKFYVKIAFYDLLRWSTGGSR